jgi:hypothetical protein
MPVPTPAPIRLIGERWATVFDGEIALPLNAIFFARSVEEFCSPAFVARLDRPPKVA